MSVAVVLGAGKAAESITKLLLNGGGRVALVGARPAAIISALKEDAEAAIPFLFVDDIKHQEDHVRKRLARLSFHPSINEIETDLSIVFDAAGNASSTDAVHATRKLHPRTPVASVDDRIALEDAFHIALHMYQPIEYTKIAQIVHSSTTDAASISVLRKTLQKAGITEITAAEGVEASSLVSSWSGDGPSLQYQVASLIGVRHEDEKDAVMH